MYFKKQTRGFSLVELMVSVSIMLVITVAVVFRYNSFDSTLLLKTLSYDIGFSVRQAQSYSLGVRQNESEAFDAAYGVSFTPGSTQYSLFQYTNSVDPTATPRYDGSGNGDIEDVEIFTLGRSYEISEICYTTSSGETCDDGSTLSRLDISFRRPEYISLFYIEGYGGSLDAIESVSVRIVSGASDTYGDVNVGYAGQITISIVE